MLLMLEEIRHSAFDKYAKLDIFLVTKMESQSWQAETEDGEYVAIRFKDGCLQMDKSETLYELGNDFDTIALDKDYAVNLLKKFETRNLDKREIPNPSSVSIGEIMTFMGWKAIPDQVWEGNNF